MSRRKNQVATIANASIETTDRGFPAILFKLDLEFGSVVWHFTGNEAMQRFREAGRKTLKGWQGLQCIVDADISRMHGFKSFHQLPSPEVVVDDLKAITGPIKLRQPCLTLTPEPRNTELGIIKSAELQLTEYGPIVELTIQLAGRALYYRIPESEIMSTLKKAHKYPGGTLEETWVNKPCVVEASHSEIHKLIEIRDSKGMSKYKKLVEAVIQNENELGYITDYRLGNIDKSVTLRLNIAHLHGHQQYNIRGGKVMEMLEKVDDAKNLIGKGILIKSEDSKIVVAEELV